MADTFYTGKRAALARRFPQHFKEVSTKTLALLLTIVSEIFSRLFNV
jgi:hypothetical protein